MRWFLKIVVNDRNKIKNSKPKIKNTNQKHKNDTKCHCESALGGRGNLTFDTFLNDMGLLRLRSQRLRRFYIFTFVFLIFNISYLIFI